MAYSAQGSLRVQEVGLYAVMQRNTDPISWLVCSVRPLDSGWEPGDMLTVAPMNLQKAFQNVEMNCGPQSEQTAKAENKLNNFVSGFFGRGEFGEGNEVGGFTKSIDDSEDGVLPYDRGNPVKRSREM